MAKTIITANQDAVISEIEIAAPAERVFQALTNPDQLMGWFTNPDCPAKFWKMDARPGGNYSFVSESTTVVVNGVSEFKCHGEILEFDPPRVLVYTWISNWHVDTMKETVVRWELTPTSGGTKLTVTHSGLVEEPEARKDYRNGWVGVIENLKQFTEIGEA